MIPLYYSKCLRGTFLTSFFAGCSLTSHNRADVRCGTEHEWEQYVLWSLWKLGSSADGKRNFSLWYFWSRVSCGLRKNADIITAPDFYENTGYYNKCSKHVIMKSPVNGFKESKAPIEISLFLVNSPDQNEICNSMFPTVSWNTVFASRLCSRLFLKTFCSVCFLPWGTQLCSW